MKTKQQMILGSGCVFDTDDQMLSVDAVEFYACEELMQEYADQEMIAFAEWLGKSGTVHVQDNIFMTPTFGRGGRRTNTSELLTKYKEECKSK